ncbi:MAG: hypothetical protein LWY06_13155 [Firmicutes bacterium]|nr:hypothetical protein [Bacillota bacterium]
MDQVHPVNGKPESINPADLIREYSKVKTKPAYGHITEKAAISALPRDMADISFKPDLKAQNQTEEDYRKSLKAYESGLISPGMMNASLETYFRTGGAEARQETVEHLFGTDVELKARTASLFAGIKNTGEISPLDEAACDKALYCARDGLKKEPVSKTSYAGFMKTIGKMGESEDLPLLLDASKNAQQKSGEKSYFLQNTSVKAVKDLVERKPEAVNKETKSGVSSMIVNSMNSNSREVRKNSASLLMKLSDNRDLTGTFTRMIKELPKNENTAGALGLFASNLQSGIPDRVTFTSLVLDKTMKGANNEFKYDLLSEATERFGKYPPQGDMARDTAAILGRHYESLLDNKGKEAFKSLSPDEKIAKMTTHFHG